MRGVLMTKVAAAACVAAGVLSYFGNSEMVASSTAYGSGERRVLDVYAPRGARNAPLVVFFYGGSWQGGRKGTYRFLARALAARGVVVVVPDYRVYPDVRFPAFLEDAAAAVAWTKTHAADFGGDAHKMFLMGHSAGAYIAAMLAYDAQWLQQVDMAARRDIAGFVGIAGPYDFLPIKDPILRKIFAVSDLAKTQPINFVGGGEPPAFIGTPALDSVVDPDNSKRLAAALRAKGVDVTEKVYAGGLVGHVTIIAAFAPIIGTIAPVRNDVLSFIMRVSVAQAREYAS